MTTKSKLLDHERRRVIGLAVEYGDVRHFESRVRAAMKQGRPVAAKTAYDMCKRWKHGSPGGYEAEAVNDGLLVVTPDGRVDVIGWGAVVDHVLAFADEEMI